MKAPMNHIFFAGGGSADDSRWIDEQFVASLDQTKPLIYIPNAMESQSYQSCLEWFCSVMTPLHVTNIEMWSDLQVRHPVSAIAGVYIGGGNTVKLLREIFAVGFGDYLLKAADAGLPIYGGSAGAIILGADIRTAPEARMLNAVEAKGLNMALGYSIVCHYDGHQEAVTAQLAQTLGHSILAFPEKTGGSLFGDVLTNHGMEPISIFQGGTISKLDVAYSTSI